MNRVEEVADLLGDRLTKLIKDPQKPLHQHVFPLTRPLRGSIVFDVVSIRLPILVSIEFMIPSAMLRGRIDNCTAAKHQTHLLETLRQLLLFVPSLCVNCGEIGCVQSKQGISLLL
jgi:hypothetical protein